MVDPTCFTAPFTAHRSESSRVLLPSSSGGLRQTAGRDFVMDVKKLWRRIDPALPPPSTAPRLIVTPSAVLQTCQHCFDHPAPSGGDHVHCSGDSNEKTRTEVKVLQKQQNPYRDTLKTSRNTFKRRERPQIYRRSGQFAFALQPALWTRF